MAIVLDKKLRLRAEELYTFGAPEKFVEIIEGEFIQHAPWHYRYGRASHELLVAVADFCASRDQLCYGHPNDGYLIKRHPDTLLICDTCVFRRRHIGDKYLDFAPEAVFYLCTPQRSATELLYRRHQFFSEGTEQFWVLDLDAPSAAVHYPDGRVLIASEEDALLGEGVMQGFRLCPADYWSTDAQ